MPEYLRTHFFRAERSSNGCDSECGGRLAQKPPLWSQTCYHYCSIGFSPIWHTSNTAALRDEELALTVVAWLALFLFAGYSGYDVLGLV